MNLLSDAEYRQLTDIQKADYWRSRFYEVEEDRDRLKEEVKFLRETISRIHDATNGHRF